MARIVLPQIGRAIEVPEGGTILASALEAGIAYPHGCRAGRCAGCKSRLLSGEVELLPHTRFALSAEERADGLILACRAQPKTDAVVAWLGGADEIADASVRRHAGRIASIEDATHDIKLVRIAIEDRDAFRFRPGQYASIGFDGAPPRDYSMASGPAEEELEFHIRRVPGGRTSARIGDAVRPGDPVALEGPFGSAFLRTAHEGPIVAVAGGSGLAPIKSIVEEALARDADRAIRLYFGVRGERDLYLTERLETLATDHPNVSFVPVLSAEETTRRRTGFVADVMAADLGALDGWKAYVAGPPVMVETVGQALLDRGVPPADIHADVFFTPAEPGR